MTDVFPIAAAAVGAIAGSLTNVLIHRIPRGRSVLWPPSSCPACGARVRPWDNVPIVSYLVLRGRCRDCGARISPRYLAVEALTAAAFGWLAARDGMTLAWLRDATLVVALTAAAFIDIEHRRIPNAVTVPAIAAGLLFAAAAGRLAEAGASAIGAAAFFALAGAVARGGIGGGDVKLAAVIGAFLGWPGVLLALTLGTGLGALGGIALILSGRATRKTALPFGPALTVGAAAALWWGRTLAAWLGLA